MTRMTGKHGKGAHRRRAGKQIMRPKRKGGHKHFKYWRDAKGTGRAALAKENEK